tara:strand:- start:874 stop:2394 length:1521 start_codon:yes stop_codon:yes gene_type:complete
MTKIFDVTQVKKLIDKKRKRKKIIIGLCHGVFDLLHIGHIKHFEQAKKTCDVLVVSVTSDEFVNKGPNRPSFSLNLRMDALASLEKIDFVCSSNHPTAVNNLKIIKPDYYIKGIEYKDFKNDLSGEIKNEISTVKKIKAKILYTRGITSSSSKLINNSIQDNSKKRTFLEKIKKKLDYKKIQDVINNFSDETPLVIGETIIDQYNFTEAIGKSGKEPNLVLRDLKSEEFIGGAAAIAKNLSQYCKEVYLLTMIGQKGEYLKEIKNKLPKNIKIFHIKKDNSPTIVKKRYLDSVSKNKLLGVYKINDENLSKKQENSLYSKLSFLEKKSTFIIVSDYGHGFLTKKISKKIVSVKKYVAINAQINANNIGYHSLENYKKVDCIIINEKELRHEMRNRTNEIKNLIKNFAQTQNVKDLIVTRGSNGALLYNKHKKVFYEIPAFAERIVDKVGSGDNMLALSSLSLKNSKEKNLALLLGSLAAADNIKNFGNKKTVNKKILLKSIDHLLK